MRRATPWLLLVLPLVLLFLFLLLPYLMTFCYSTTGATIGRLSDVPFVGLANFEAVLSSRNPPFAGVLVVTATFTAGTLVGSLVLGTALALALYTVPAGRRSALLAVFLVPWVIAGVVIGYTWKLMYDPEIGLANTLLEAIGIAPVSWLSDKATSIAALVIANVWAGYGIVLLVISAALANVPPNLILAGQVDGASVARIVRRIILPAIRPAFLLAALVALVGGLNTFDLIYAMTKRRPALPDGDDGPGDVPPHGAEGQHRSGCRGHGDPVHAQPRARGHLRVPVAARGAKVDLIRLSPLQRTLRLVLIVLALLFTILPLLWIISIALRPGSQAIFPISVMPSSLTLDNIYAVLFGPNAIGLTPYQNAAVYGLVAAITTAVASSLGGYALARYDVQGRPGGADRDPGPQLPAGRLPDRAPVHPPLRLGPVRRPLFVILAYAGGSIPLGIWLMAGTFRQIPIRLEQAARIDGAGAFMTMRRRDPAAGHPRHPGGRHARLHRRLERVSPCR